MSPRFANVAIALAASTALLSGCANPPIVALSTDTYLLTRTDKGGVFGNAAAMKADVIREASEFAARQGKVAVPLEMRDSPLVVGRSFASVEYQFRVVDKSDPEAGRVSLVPRPNLIVEKTTEKNLKQDIVPQKDVYAELIKLDDLKKRGILTQDEFDAQKARLLGGR